MEIDGIKKRSDARREMALVYKNRLGDLYYLQVGATRTGKPKYYMGRKLTGSPIAEVPEGYEIYEMPENGQVVVRKVKPSAITGAEKELVEDGIRRHAGLQYFIVVVDGKSIVVYLPDQSEDAADELISDIGSPDIKASPARRLEARDWLITRSQYTKMLRFQLTDSEQRQFTVERWCFRGAIDNWIFLNGPAPLPQLVSEYAKHLGKESFFEMM